MAQIMADKKATTVKANPTKRFFVEMLTRDIELQDAILDLLDNCVDGILRSTKDKHGKRDSQPYRGYWARITLNEKKFQIVDNCGGIPLALAKHYGFIISKGFKVHVNGTEVQPKPLSLLWSDPKKVPKDKVLSPYIYQATIDGVEVRLAVGMYKPIPSEDELDEEQVTRRTKE